MNPWISQALADDRQTDLVCAAARHSQRMGRPATPCQSDQQASWDTRLGWLLIRVGLRLVSVDGEATSVTPLGSPAR